MVGLVWGIVPTNGSGRGHWPRSMEAAMPPGSSVDRVGKATTLALVVVVCLSWSREKKLAWVYWKYVTGESGKKRRNDIKKL